MDFWPRPHPRSPCVSRILIGMIMIGRRQLMAQPLSEKIRSIFNPAPIKAVMDALGVEAVRSGSKRDLRARVYFQHPGQPLSMVRLYSKSEKSADA
jgi:hypothetical protein